MEASDGESVRFDVIVVGAGIMGSCAAYAAASRGARVLLLEQFDLLHHRGSSHGESRTIRATYPQAHYPPMVRLARRLWDDAQRDAGYTVLTPTPHLDLGPRAEPALLAAVKNGGATEVVSGAGAGAWPWAEVFRVPDGWMAATSEFGGVMKATPRTFHCLPHRREHHLHATATATPARALPMRHPRRGGLAVLALALAVALAVRGADASIHEYSGGGFTPRANSFFFHGGSEGLYASDPSSNSSASFIRFDSVTFRRAQESAARHEEMQQKTGLVEAIIVEIQDRDKIGGSYLHSDAICCTPELDKDKSCKVGEVIIRPNPDNPDWPKRIQTFFDGKNEETSMVTQSVSINKTGMYYLYFMFCDPQLKGLKITGTTVWRNPDGYLPGKMAPMMTFYGFMSLAYLVLGLLWFLQFVRCWKDILQLHYHITAVIALGMCEMAFWYFEYANFNSTGTRPMGITLWAVTFTAVKKTVCRLLLLAVSMGYGLVRPTLGGITSRVAALGVIYFIASEALELVENLGNNNDFSGKKRLFLVLPVAILDATFIIWIFSSLSRTLEKLQLRRSMAKLELYRKFTNYLAMSVLISIAWIGYELYFNATDPLSELWRRAWIIPAFWNVLSYVLLAIICILWSPSHNPTGFAYSEDTGEEADEEGLSLVGSAVKGTGDMVNMHVFPEDKRA